MPNNPQQNQNQRPQNAAYDPSKAGKNPQGQEAPKRSGSSSDEDEDRPRRGPQSDYSQSSRKPSDY